MSPLPHHGPRNEELVWRRWEWSPSNATPTDLYYVLMPRGDQSFRRRHGGGVLEPHEFPAIVEPTSNGMWAVYVYAIEDGARELIADKVFGTLDEAKDFAQKLVAKSYSA